MSTNYYVDAPACPNACEHCTATERLHLGQSAAGWRFLFRADEHWPRNEAFAHWVRRALSGRIVDEYDREHTLAELLDDVERARNLRSRNEPSEGFAFVSCGHEFHADEFS